MNSDLLAALNEIEDPELGIGIVDLGLVYRAEWTESGIDVAFTMTAPSCPFAARLRDLVEEMLRRRFGEAASIRVAIVWDPPWRPDQINETAREKLGWRQPQTAPPRAGLGRILGFWRH